MQDMYEPGSGGGVAEQNGPQYQDRMPPEVRVSPYVDREILKAKDDHSRAVASGQYDEIQLEELWNKTDDYVKRLRQSSAEEVPKPARDTLQQEFEEQVLERPDGKMFQKNKETGNFEVLSEPVKDERQIEEMHFQRQMDTEKGRIDLMKQLAGLSTGTTDGGKKPMYSPEQIRQEVDRLLPSSQQAESPQGRLTGEQFDQQWGQLPSGESLVGPDGKTYRKR